MIVALGSVLGSFLTLFALTQVTDVSIFALNLVTGLGLGLGIDYALLIVNRFREELHAGQSVEDSVQKTVASAGRTVFFSGLAVTLVLASLVVFPQYFLKSFAYAGVSVVIFAVLASLFALPAVLAMVGTRIDKYAVRKAVKQTKDDGAWAWLARNVMKRPLIVITGTLIVLAGISMPALSANFGQVDDRVLPKDNPAAISSAVLRDRFNGQQTTPIEVLVPKASGSSESVQKLADDVSNQSGVVSVLSPTTYIDNRTALRVAASQPSQVSTDYYRITAVTQNGPRESSSVDIVRAIRNMNVPEATLVGGASAVYADSQSGIANKLPFVFTWLAIATLFVLFLYTGSVLLPIKAVILNLLSLSATLGLVTWVFQEGHMMWLTGDFTVTGTLDTSMIVLIAVVAFGLSMDYEVFMLSRIKEEHDRGASTADAVSFGLQRSGRIITAAAVLIALVFACFMTSGVTNIKMLGLGTAFAIMLDASIIRGLLVPALMRVAGRWNWWAPKPLAKFHARFGITE
jgi:RND superfamily putative drug exporter